jgi:hypothetical protein
MVVCLPHELCCGIHMRLHRLAKLCAAGVVPAVV